MNTNYLYEELSYEYEEEIKTKEEKIKDIQKFWGCDEENAIAFYNRNMKLGGK